MGWSCKALSTLLRPAPSATCEGGLTVQEGALPRPVFSPLACSTCAMCSTCWQLKQNKRTAQVIIVEKFNNARIVRKMSTTRNLGVRLTGNLVTDLAEFEATTGVEGTTLARELLAAALKYFKEHGSITFPLAVLPASLLKQATACQPLKGSAVDAFFEFAKSLGIDLPAPKEKAKAGKG